MASSSRKAQDLKAKEAKQKKILAVAMVLFVGLLAFQMPKLMHHGGNASAAPVVPPPAAAPADGSTTSLAPPNVGAAAPSTPTTGTATPSSGLADTDVVASAGEGKLIQFDLFASKDPFVQQVKDVAAGGATPTAPAAGSPSGSPPSTTTTSSPPTGIGIGSAPPTAGNGPGSTSLPPGTPTTAVATLLVNGTAEQVQAGHDFPVAAPAFRLLTMTAAEAKISVVGGSFQSGAPAITLVKGRTLTLMNTADGTKYVLAYRGSKTVATSSLPADAVATTPTATAPAATTPTTTSTTTTTTSSGG